MAFELPQLPYAYDALEPHIDARTMEIHHSKHHNAYTTNLNAAIAGTDLDGKTIENILMNLDMKNMAVRNNGGGFYNHNLYFIMHMYVLNDYYRCLHKYVINKGHINKR